MALNKIVDKVVDTDVLVIGGGIGGCPAAAKAAEHKLNVTLVEKAKPERSGNAAHGIDEIQVFPRDGISALELTKLRLSNERHGARFGTSLFSNPNIVYKIISNAFWVLEELEKLGVTMKWDDGDYYWFPYQWYPPLYAKVQLRVHWQNVKPEMAAAVRKRGVNVLERTMVVDLLTNKGRVVGATAVNTRTGEFIVIKAKAVVIATGKPLRYYNCETPFSWKYKMRYHWCPASISGDGAAVAYRAGAGLVNTEDKHSIHLRDDLTINYSAIVLNDGLASKELTWNGKELSHWPMGLEYMELERKGLDPLYHSIEHLPDDFHKRVEAHCADYGMLRLKIAQDRGFNYKTHRFQLMFNTPCYTSPAVGVLIDENFESPSLKGLYTVGDCATGVGGCLGASTSGLLVGDSIDKYVSESREPVVDEAQVETQKQVALAPLAVSDGTEPMELECATRQICESYAGMVLSEGRLREGLKRLGSLKRVFLPKLVARSPHQLMRCLEARNIMDMAELHMQASLERKETRGPHVRIDYPEKDPSRANMITYQWLDNGKAVLELMKVPELKPEIAKGGK
jgi:succinate dehydrogenase/fumarate reductase flavoprotein subunit